MAESDATSLYRSFIEQDPAGAIQVIERARTSGVAQDDLFDVVYAPAMAALGAAWASAQIDEIAFTQAAVVAEQVGSFVMPQVARRDTGVSLVVGVMHRDYHSIAKNVVAATLNEAGYRVHDLGVDVRPADFLERVEETGARILIVFAETIAAATAVRRVRDMLEQAGRTNVVMLVCGGPFGANAALAKSVGANGVVLGAESALKLLGRIVRDSAEAESGAEA